MCFGGFLFAFFWGGGGSFISLKFESQLVFAGSV